MKRIVIDYHVDTPVVHCSAESVVSPVSQQPVGSVFIVDPVSNHLVDVLSQVVQDPNNPRNQMLLSQLQKVGTDSNSHLSDDDLLSMVRSRYCQTPSEVDAFSKYLKSYINSHDVDSKQDSESESQLYSSQASLSEVDSSQDSLSEVEK